MFQIVAVPVDAYAALPRPDHCWLLVCVSRYVDRTGKAWPSMRQLAADTRMSLSTVSRRLKEMADLGVFQRTRKGVGRYVYHLADAYRPRWPGRVSAEKHGVSQAATSEQVEPTKQTSSRARLAADPTAAAKNRIYARTAAATAISRVRRASRRS